MLKIDKGSDDQERSKNPVCDCYLPREPLPDCEEKEGCNEFHYEVAKRNPCAAICAPAAKREPTDQRQILMPWNRLFALRTKRPPRSVDGEIHRPAIDANVQKRADRRPEQKRKPAEEKILSRMLHAVNWQSVWRRAAPSATRSRCSFRTADTSAAPWQ